MQTYATHLVAELTNEIWLILFMLIEQDKLNTEIYYFGFSS